MFNLRVNVNAQFNDVDSARRIGQVIETLLENTSHFGAVKIEELPSFKSHSVVPKLFDTRNSVVGVQEAQGKASSFIKEIEKLSSTANTPEIPSDVYWADFMSNLNQTGVVDYKTFTTAASERLGYDATETVIDIIGKYEANQAARELRTPPVKVRK